MARILVVAAHPDDEVLGCGGTILRRISEGDEAYCVALSDGVSSRYENPSVADFEAIGKRADCFNKASELLGFKKHWLLSLPDNRFDSVPLLEIVKTIEEVKNEVKPDIVYTHFQGDLNIDHRTTVQAVLTACRPLPEETTKEIYAFKIPSSTEWAASVVGDSHFKPNVFIDISKTLEQKIEAMKVYKSEIKPFPHPRSPEALKASAMHWGTHAGLKAAETFMLIRKIAP